MIRFANILMAIGICVFLFGAGCMDSASLKIPVLICIGGIVLTAIGCVIRSRYVRIDD